MKELNYSAVNQLWVLYDYFNVFLMEKYVCSVTISIMLIIHSVLREVPRDEHLEKPTGGCKQEPTKEHFQFLSPTGDRAQQLSTNFAA